MDERRTFIVAVTSPSSWSSSLVSRWKRRTCETWARRALPCAISASISARTSAISARERSEEHTSELQSHSDLVCRLLLEKKKKSPSYGRRNEEADALKNGAAHAARMSVVLC